MTIQTIIPYLIPLFVSAIIGGIAGTIMGGGHGLIGNAIFGVLGGYCGVWLANKFNIPITGTLGNVIASIVGACVVIFIFRLIFKM